MTKLELERLWDQAGGNPAKAAEAAAIALAESSGRVNATDYNTNGTVDRGLWQINSIHGAQSTYNPLANAKAAVAISNNGTNFTPWVTYNSGAFRQYLGAPGSAGSSTAEGVTGEAGPTSSSSSTGTATPGGLVGLGIHASLYLALLLGAVALLWLGTRTAMGPAGRKGPK